ncbi:MAG: hypothetical protein JXE07_01540 [Candidatus Aminicenantes bacterium]|nr:hypothetical protein [Candidatus Aminicenantes bacterium]
MILESHLFSMIVYAFFVSVVLALLRRDDRRGRVKYGLSLFLVMVGGALLFGWFMYIFAR